MYQEPYLFLNYFKWNTLYIILFLYTALKDEWNNVIYYGSNVYGI